MLFITTRPCPLTSAEELDLAGCAQLKNRAEGRVLAQIANFRLGDAHGLPDDIGVFEKIRFVPHERRDAAG